MTTKPDQSVWRRKAQRRCVLLTTISLAALVIAFLAHAWIDRWPTTVKLGRSSVRSSIHCISPSGRGVMRIDYDLWLGTSYTGRLPLDTGVQTSLQRWPADGIDPEGKPTYAEALQAIQAEFAKLCASHGCPQIAATVDLEQGAGNLRILHPEYAARRRAVDALEFVQGAAVLAGIAGSLGLVVTTLQRWRDKRTIPAWCCQRCRYDLRGIAGRTCPECGGPGLNRQ